MEILNDVGTFFLGVAAGLLISIVIDFLKR